MLTLAARLELPLVRLYRPRAEFFDGLGPPGSGGYLAAGRPLYGLTWRRGSWRLHGQLVQTKQPVEGRPGMLELAGQIE